MQPESVPALIERFGLRFPGVAVAKGQPRRSTTRTALPSLRGTSPRREQLDA